ncbi:MAG TPA: TetR/AcrR family transcriptional regulator [Microvirga sp.]|jgi:AcrR family transcriptional regulator|nr:TetR/AcrR family transcriptional regulator [Microvirga sp.]
MDQALAPSRADTEAAAERRARILDAAERCIVRSGFHRTTMQDVAAEAGMSPGNLYRYFRSKDMIVAGLAERDRAQMAAELSALENTDDFVAAFARLGRKHFEEEPRERAVLCLQIWAEAMRNPDFATLTGDFERELVVRIAGLLGAAQDRGVVSAASDPDAIARVIAAFADGLFVRRAVAPDFDAKREVDHIMKVIGALLDGTVSLSNDKR